MNTELEISHNDFESIESFKKLIDSKKFDINNIALYMVKMKYYNKNFLECLVSRGFNTNTLFEYDNNKMTLFEILTCHYIDHEILNDFLELGFTVDKFILNRDVNLYQYVMITVVYNLNRHKSEVNIKKVIDILNKYNRIRLPDESLWNNLEIIAKYNRYYGDLAIEKMDSYENRIIAIEGAEKLYKFMEELRCCLNDLK